MPILHESYETKFSYGVLRLYSCPFYSTFPTVLMLTPHCDEDESINKSFNQSVIFILA